MFYVTIGPKGSTQHHRGLKGKEEALTPRLPLKNARVKFASDEGK